MKNQIDEWYQEGIIVKSNSEYASPLVVIKKGNNELRLCVDYRNLNKKTVRDAYPIPRIDDSLEALKGAKIFSCFDLKSAYNQIKVNKSDQHKTAFSSPSGLYEFTRMPFGLVNAPATFQRIMSNIFRDEIFKYVVCYLDDILVYSKSWSDHIKHVRVVMGKLAEVGFRLNMKKCKLGLNEVTFLGMNISEKGMGTNVEKTRAIKNWPRPVNLRDLRSFLGVGSYYMKFIKGYAEMVAPLTKLIRTGIEEGKVSRRRSKRVGISWNGECEEAMIKLKDRISNAPVLSLPIYGEPFIVETDASNKGLGAVLSQRIEGKIRVIAFASRALSTGERVEAN